MVSLSRLWAGSLLSHGLAAGLAINRAHGVHLHGTARGAERSPTRGASKPIDTSHHHTNIRRPQQTILCLFGCARLQLETVHIWRQSTSVDGLNFRCTEENLLRSTVVVLIQRTSLNVRNGASNRT
jgi:hypothetical protein